MNRRYLNIADGEALIVPQLGALALRTECGLLEVAPGEIAIIPRGLKFAVDLPGDAARGYVCENLRRAAGAAGTGAGGGQRLRQ